MVSPSLEEAWEIQEAGAGEDGNLLRSKNQTLEEELHTLQAFIPWIAEDISSIFKEAVADSLWNILSEKEARALLMLIGETGFESPSDVYATLDFILRSGSQILKSAIEEEFCANVHLLIEKVEKRFTADFLSAIGSVFP